MNPKIIIAAALLALWVGLCLTYASKVESAPPHPSKHYKWQSLSNGSVVLYFLENGYYSRYVYLQKQNVEPAVNCNHSYDQDQFRLITFDTTFPYWYTLYMEPIQRWDVSTKQYIKLEVEK